VIIVGCDYHPSFQQVAFVDTESGELKEQRLGHREGAEEFYRALAATGQQVRVGMEPLGMHAGSNDCWANCSRRHCQRRLLATVPRSHHQNDAKKSRPDIGRHSLSGIAATYFGG
jgi:hypothetical protein